MPISSSRNAIATADGCPDLETAAGGSGDVHGLDNRRKSIMDVKLMVVGGEGDSSEILPKLPATIGRGNQATLKLSHPLISRRHCELFSREDELLVRDLGSLNGTFIGGERITEAELRSGDLLTIGTVTFRVAIDGLPVDDHASSGQVDLDAISSSETSAGTTTLSPDLESSWMPHKRPERVSEKNH